jgi:alpha-D-xyloside xylohydrolase
MAKLFKYDLNLGIDKLVDMTRESSKFAVLGLWNESDMEYILELEHDYSSVYGMGERFNCVNQKGLTIEVEVIEKFCNQGSVSYCPIPFFFTNHEFGVYVDTQAVSKFKFEDKIQIHIRKDSKGKLPVIYLFEGAPKEIIESFSKITGKPVITPKWSFGPWMSANRWNTEKEVLRQLSLTEQYEIPHSVMVLEAWSDEATFYRFNEHGEWDNPKRMTKELLDKGIHLILWQIPVLKRMDHGEKHEFLDKDWQYAIEHNLCIKNSDGTIYNIPEGHWFAGSLLPDFTNQETVKWWFDKRKYLLEMGVSGFKTDGGEFILTDDVVASNGLTGIELRNYYASSYVEAYTRFIGADRVLFSRAGYVGQQKYPMQWAGDQMSTWEEFRHIIVAGLSIGLSGIPLWGFDIGGFAGEMPSMELYERATQFAVFAPVMQWHSEPVGGQFSELLQSTEGINDRSPWNLSLLYGDEQMIRRIKFHFNLRMNLLPYIYHQALLSGETGLPMMKHLILEYPEDEHVYDIEDSFMLGDILVAPIIEEGKTERFVYLPKGTWYSLWPITVKLENNSDELLYKLKGGCSYLIQCGKERIPAFVREGGCIALNLDETFKLGSYVGNQTSGYHNLCFYTAGDTGEYHFEDDLDNVIDIRWENGNYTLNQLSGQVKVVVSDMHKAYTGVN